MNPVKNIQGKVRRILSNYFNLPLRPSLILLKLFEKRSLIAVEVGVSIGNNARDMLSHIPQIKRLYLVDPYRYADNREDQHRIHGNLLKLQEYKQTAKKNLAPFKNKTVFIYEPFCSKLIPEKVDFIYIDGDHSTKAVISDIKESLKILNNGGMIAGHDIHYESVKKGVEIMFAKNYNTFGYDWWIKTTTRARE